MVRFWAFIAVAWVQFLVGELRSCKLCRVTKMNFFLKKDIYLADRASIYSDVPGMAPSLCLLSHVVINRGSFTPRSVLVYVINYMLTLLLKLLGTPNQIIP